MTKEELLNQLLNIKNDQLTFLTNFIVIILAIAGIIVVFVTIYYGWLARNISIQKDKSDDLLKDLQRESKMLKEKEEKLAEQQKLVDNIIESQELVNRLSKIEKYMESTEVYVNRLKEKEVEKDVMKEEKEKRRLLFSLERYLLYLGSARIEMGKEDAEFYEKIKEFQERINYENIVENKEEAIRYLEKAEEVFDRYGGVEGKHFSLA